jgi:hypothetical protein
LALRLQTHGEPDARALHNMPQAAGRLRAPGTRKPSADATGAANAVRLAVRSTTHGEPDAGAPQYVRSGRQPPTKLIAERGTRKHAPPTRAAQRCRGTDGNGIEALRPRTRELPARELENLKVLDLQLLAVYRGIDMHGLAVDVIVYTHSADCGKRLRTDFHNVDSLVTVDLVSPSVLDNLHAGYD